MQSYGRHNMQKNHGLPMDHIEVKRYWEENAATWTQLVRAGYDVYRDCLNTPAFFDMLPAFYMFVCGNPLGAAR